MKAQEKNEVIALIIDKAKKRGIPINVRTGGNDELAEWLEALLEELLPVDEPIGVIRGTDYDRCPRCGGVAGQSAYYCKKCGAWLRQVM